MESTKLKPNVIGLYGISGSGKTTILKELQLLLSETTWSFYEGSAVLSDVVGDGGLERFGQMEQKERARHRQQAIETIQKRCEATGTTGVVAGHGTLWENGSVAPITTPADFEVYTHIIYLNASAEVISQRIRDDETRTRQSLSIEELSRWQETEREQLREDCIAHNILFCSLDTYSSTKIKNFIEKFTLDTEESNLSSAKRQLGTIWRNCQDRQLSTILLLDGDKTLSAQDTGSLFWEKRSKMLPYTLGANPLEKAFRYGYSYKAFRQAALLYEEACNDEEYDILCDAVASEVKLYPEFVCLLHFIARQQKVKAIIVTSGLRDVWEKVLKRESLSDDVEVIGGGRFSDGLVVTADVKKGLASVSRHGYEVQTWAFGDSPLDIGMMIAAHIAIVVVGDEETRSKSMEKELLDAIERPSLSASQVLLPETNPPPPRLDTTKLPLAQLTSTEVTLAILHGRPSPKPPLIYRATDYTGKLLMTPMRDASVSGPDLREAHHRVGWFLATQHLGDIVGLEEYPIAHVNGTKTTGHRFRHEKQMTIVALMRGGEPMAFGVSAAAPKARFMHANNSEDITSIHLAGQITMVLVDSVINSGKSVLDFVRHIRSLHATIRVVIIVGVVQEDFIKEGKLDEFGNVSLIMLRKSENKYTGSGGTDTGNRLFNTTYLK